MSVIAGEARHSTSTENRSSFRHRLTGLGTQGPSDSAPQSLAPEKAPFATSGASGSAPGAPAAEPAEQVAKAAVSVIAGDAVASGTSFG